MTRNRWAQTAFALLILGNTTACDKFHQSADEAVATDAVSIPSVGSDDATAGVFSIETPADPVAFLNAMFADDGTAGLVSTTANLRERYFSEELSGMLADTLRNGNGSLTSNPLCSCSNPTSLRQTIVLEHGDNHKAVARVTVTPSDPVDGPAAHLLISMARGEEGWKVTDVGYPDEKTSLRDTLAKANAPLLDQNAVF